MVITVLQHREPSRGEEKDQAHVIIRYHVKPSARKEFLDAWGKAEEGTGEVARCTWATPDRLAARMGYNRQTSDGGHNP